MELWRVTDYKNYLISVDSRPERLPGHRPAARLPDLGRRRGSQELARRRRAVTEAGNNEEFRKWLQEPQ